MELLQKVTHYIVVLDEKEYEAVTELLTKKSPIEITEETNKKPSSKKSTIKRPYEMYAVVDSEENFKILRDILDKLFPERCYMQNLLANAFPAELYLGRFSTSEYTDVYRAVREDIAKITHLPHQ